MALPKFQAITRFTYSSSDPNDQFDIHNPATGELITTVQGGGIAEVDKAIEAADHAFHNDWRWRAPRERAQFLLKAADRLEAHFDELATLLSLENGKPISQAREGDVPTVIAVFRYFASLVDKLPHELYDQGAIYSSVLREPFGVVAAILPFNWPPIHFGGKGAPALATGNTIVFKPGDQAPLTVMRMVELVSEVLPPGIVQAVPAAGISVPQALATHTKVKKITFTGSTRAGAAVSKLAADNIVPLSLELGGKNALIVLEDADLDLAARNALDGSYFNSGCACTAASRLLVHSSVNDAFVRKLAAGVRRLKVGHGADEATHVGPLVTKAHQSKVNEYIQLGVSEGAKIEATAPMPTDVRLKDGFFVQPTLFTGVTRTMRIAREEIFGPVAIVIKFDSTEEAISVANESEYGLVCAVFSKNVTEAMRIGRHIDAGMVFLNNYNRMALGTPFGGTKSSGYGREHCLETLKEYTWAKNMRYPTGIGVVGGWSKAPMLMTPELHGKL
ncbi:hypothetical protein H2200_011825 [Cladophialophora chaetospira]|uniref:aldehyde dehydrogenase (NAD(+)) n=1 Tax=Cladophialophora chaetospira TaxID=386627 RepID=A0AA38WYT7_9EURO|nr:hypothetical protein H2200_011825 [Cladophialophora chaetospira]